MVLYVSFVEGIQQEIIRLHQQQAYKEEVETLMYSGKGDRKMLMKRTSVYKVHPFIDERALLRVRGRLKRSNLYFTDVQPI